MNGAHRAPTLPRAAHGRHRAKTAEQLLAAYRRWAMALVALTVYVTLVLPVEYYGHGMHDPEFVFTNIGVLVGWWIVIAKTLHTWDQLTVARQRGSRAVHP